MIYSALEKLAETGGNRAAISARGSCWTYNDLLAAVRRIAVRLDHLAGSAIGLSLTHIPLQVATLLALDRLGATAVLYPATTARQWLETSSTELALAELLSNAEELESMLASGESASASVERVVVPRTENSRVVLFTSGTSGPPKPAVHTWESLSAAVSHHERHRGRRWLLSYDLFQFAGLQVMLQSLLTGGRLCAPDARDPGHVARCLENDRVECASGTPTFWRMLLSTVDLAQLARAPLTQITLGGEVADQAILDALAAAFPSARIRHIYASTEMGTCFTVSDGRAGFPLRYLDDSGLSCRLRIADDGELLIRSERSMKRYLNEQEDLEGWFGTGDLVRVEGERALFVGRKSECINVGGAKVYPADVEDVIRSVEGVREVRVWGIKSSLVGELVAADVQPTATSDPASLRRRILEACRHRLAKYQVPAVIEFHSTLCVNESGKLERSGA